MLTTCRILLSKGIDINAIEWNKAHETFNPEAAAYAEQMVSRSQNPNNNTELGSLYRDTQGGSLILRNVVLPFSSFAVNQRVRMINDMEKILRGGDKAEAIRSLTATLAEQAIFNAVKVYILAPLTTMGARSLAAAFGFWDDKDEEKSKAYENIDINIADAHFKTTDKFKKFAANTIGDFFFNGMGNATQQELQDKMNWLYSNIASETYPNGGKPTTTPKLFYTYDPSKEDRGNFTGAGMYGILPSQIADLNRNKHEVFTGTTERVIKGGTENVKQTETADITPEERKLFALSFMINVFAVAGIGDAEVTSINRKMQHIMDQKMKERYGGERILNIFSKGKGEPGASKSDITQPKLIKH